MKEQFEKALGVQMEGDFEDMTIRDYLCSLLVELWTQQEGFSGKRPFGNSGWDDDLYVPLIREGLIKGKLDEDGYIEEINPAHAHAFVADMILYVFFGGQNDQGRV